MSVWDLYVHHYNQYFSWCGGLQTSSYNVAISPISTIGYPDETILAQNTKLVTVSGLNCVIASTFLMTKPGSVSGSPDWPRCSTKQSRYFSSKLQECFSTSHSQPGLSTIKWSTEWSSRDSRFKAQNVPSRGHFTCLGKDLGASIVRFNQ